jgi:aminopeptidase N
VQLVMDKWFRIQASAISGNPAETFNALRRDPDFNLLNPNRVRALGGAFAMNNPAAFHKGDGSGYRAIAGLIGDVDPTNGALAARLSTIFEGCTRVELNRRERAEHSIQALLDRNSLSANTREILTKISTAL